MRLFTLAASATLALFAASPAMSATDPDSATSPLSGPKVDTQRATVRTLVQRDFDGKLKRLEGDPIAAALDLLDLDMAVREPADQVLGTRAAAFDALVKDNLKDIAELAGARQAGDQARARELLRGLLRTAGPLVRGEPVVDQVAATLPPEHAAELKRLVDEYNRASADDRQRTESTSSDRALGDRRDRRRAAITERLTSFGTEIRRSYERVFASKTREFEQFMKDLNLAPEQESRVQQIFVDLFQKTYGKPTRAQSSKAFLDAYAILNTEQRARLRELLADRDSGQTGAARPHLPPEVVPTPADEPMGKP